MSIISGEFEVDFFSWELCPLTTVKLAECPCICKHYNAFVKILFKFELNMHIRCILTTSQAN